MKQHFKITGSARALPERIVASSELDYRLGLDSGWTVRHTGVAQRHQMAGVVELESLVRQVCRAAVKEAGTDFSDLDLIVDASLCVQQPIPCNAALIQQSLGREARGVACMDVHASCLGFLAALNVVNGLFAAGGVGRAMVVCAETPLVGVNWDEPESACLMGDAVTAFVLEATSPERNCSFRFETYAEGARLCEVLGGGHRLPPWGYSEQPRGAFRFHMDGTAVHRFASRHFPPMLERVLAETGRRPSELHVVPHQASGPALEFMRRRLGLAPERFHVTIAEHGNLVAAGIPYVLDGVRRQLGHGTPVMVLGTAAGYTQAAAVFEL